MNRNKFEIIFISILIIWVVILSQIAPINKAEFFGLVNLNPWYKCSLILIGITFILFNHLVVQLSIVTNLVYSAIVGILLLPISFIVVRLFIRFLEKLDNQVTPIGWQYNLKWFELFIFGLLLVGATEIFGKRLKKKNSN